MGRLTLHPLNDEFAWRPPPMGAGSLTAAQERRFDQDGFFVLPGAFDADQVSRAVAEIDPLEREVEAWLRTQADGRFSIARADAITFSVHLVARSSALRTFSTAQPLLDLCADLVGPDVRLYWDQAVYKKPGARDEFPFHQDNGYTYLEPQQYLTCWVALTDTDESNGCPWVIPGLHRAGTLAHEETPLGMRCTTGSDTAVPVPAHAGDIVVFSSLTPHRTGPNRTGSERKSYILQYAPDGAQTVMADGSSVLQDDDTRQFPVLRGGERPG